MSKPHYFTDDEINRMRTGLLAMGQENNRSMDLLDGFEHQRTALYAIEKVIEALDEPRRLEEQLADDVCLALGAAEELRWNNTKHAVDAIKRALRLGLSSVLHDISEMARCGAEMEDWTQSVGHATREAV